MIRLKDEAYREPDPFPASGDEEADPTFYQRAATGSLLLAVLSGLLCGGVANAIKDQHGDWVRWVMLGTAGLFVLMSVTSLTLGIIALCGTASCGNEGITGKAIWGMLISLVLLAFFCTGFYHAARGSYILQQAVRDSSQKVLEDTRRDISNGKTLSPEKQAQRLDVMRQSLDAASQEATGDSALVAKAGSEYLGRMQAEMKAYGDAAKRVITPPLLDLSAVHQREQLAAKKDLVNQFMAANQKFRDFMSNQEKIFAGELDSFSVSPARRETEVAAFHRSASLELDSELKMRDDDLRLAVAWLSILDLLDQNWGKWTYYPGAKKVVFESGIAEDKYLGLTSEIMTAARDQAALQAKLLNAASKPAM